MTAVHPAGDLKRDGFLQPCGLNKALNMSCNGKPWALCHFLADCCKIQNIPCTVTLTYLYILKGKEHFIFSIICLLT